MLDIVTILQDAARREIEEQEDAKLFKMLSYIVWCNDDKCKKNFVLNKRDYSELKVLFKWYIHWANTRQKYDYSGWLKQYNM